MSEWYVEVEENESDEIPDGRDIVIYSPDGEHYRWGPLFPDSDEFDSTLDEAESFCLSKNEGEGAEE